MDSPAVALTPSIQSHRIPRWGWGVLAVGLLLYGVLLGTHVGAYAGGSDSSGYINNARLLAEHRVQIERRALPGLPPEKARPYTYVPLGFIPVQERDMVPTYPVGVSLLIVGVSQVVGWEAAPNVMMWLHGVMGVVLLFALAREAGLSFPMSLLATLLLAISPLYLFMSVQAMSDTPSLTWCAAAVWFAWQSRRNARWAVAVGAATAIAVLVRPSNLLIMLPVSICLGVDWRRWLWLGIGAAPGAIF
ncbi:MAG: glycosyltransferase family 39 protein, partial [Opitutaceae bacterium]